MKSTSRIGSLSIFFEHTRLQTPCKHISNASHLPLNICFTRFPISQFLCSSPLPRYNNIMFFNNIICTSPPVRYEPRYTYVERLPTGKLCLVRKRRNSHKFKQYELVEVYRDDSRPREIQEPQPHAPKHRYGHCHIVHDEGSNGDHVLIEVREPKKSERGQQSSFFEIWGSS